MIADFILIYILLLKQGKITSTSFLGKKNHVSSQIKVCHKDISDFTEWLNKIYESQYEETNVEMRAIHGAAFVNKQCPRASKTFWECCDDEVLKVAFSSSEISDRINFVSDKYLRKALKSKPAKAEEYVWRFLYGDFSSVWRLQDIHLVLIWISKICCIIKNKQTQD